MAAGFAVARNDPVDRFDTGAATHVGKVRRRNEDNFLIHPQAGLWAVADGMGGHEAGELASSTVINALKTIEHPNSAAELLASCEERVAFANSTLNDIGRKRGKIIGTTIAILLAFDSYFACVWSGDSRIYLIRRGAIVPLSRDHSEVQELIAEGRLTPEQARDWRGSNAITRAIGVHDDPQLEIKHGVLEPEDAFVICSDGLTAHVEDDEIRDHVIGRSPQNACDALVALTLERGATDNVTIVAIRYEPSDVEDSSRGQGLWE
jgi:protein phosphatase